MPVIWHCRVYIQSTMWLWCGSSMNERGCFLPNEWETPVFPFVLSLHFFLILLNWFLLPYFLRIIFVCRSLIHLLHFCVINTCWSNVELNSTLIFILPDPVSGSNGQIILQCFILVFSKLPPSSCCCGTLKILDILENWTWASEFTMINWTAKCWNK